MLAADHADTVEEAIDGFYGALNALFKGELEPMNEVWKHSDDVTYMGPKRLPYPPQRDVAPWVGERYDAFDTIRRSTTPSRVQACARRHPSSLSSP